MKNKKEERCVVVFNEEGEAIRWGLADSEIIKKLQKKFVSIMCDTKEIAKIFCKEALWG